MPWEVKCERMEAALRISLPRGCGMKLFVPLRTAMALRGVAAMLTHRSRCCCHEGVGFAAITGGWGRALSCVLSSCIGSFSGGKSSVLISSWVMAACIRYYRIVCVVNWFALSRY